MAATLNGDHRKDVYPHKLVEKMTVAEGAMYVEKAFHKFRHDCDKARVRGADDSEIVVVAPTKTPPKATSKSFAHKMYSCLVSNSYNIGFDSCKVDEVEAWIAALLSYRQMKHNTIPIQKTEDTPGQKVKQKTPPLRSINLQFRNTTQSIAAASRHGKNYRNEYMDVWIFRCSTQALGLVRDGL
ncbi:hypothetical protein QYF36_002138 [Acer negundo]|nr:hypothetical protein QYF36_002138 [Acer negundo]